MKWMMPALLFLFSALALATPAPEGAEVYFITPADGDTLTGPVTVRFGLKNMGVSPAGHDAPNTGHHHLLIDVTDLPPLDQPLPKSANVVHFGGGQTETTLELPPGEHTLQLLLGDFSHLPHQPPVMSKRITVIVR